MGPSVGAGITENQALASVVGENSLYQNWSREQCSVGLKPGLRSKIYSYCRDVFWLLQCAGF